MAIQVKMTPHLGQDRQHNEFWCLEVAGTGLVVLCQEYSHVRPSCANVICERQEQAPLTHASCLLPMPLNVSTLYLN